MSNQFLPFSLNSHFFKQYLNFADYIQDTREQILKARVDLENLDSKELERRIDANAPCEFPTSNTTHKPTHGILLIHGLSSSPYGMQSLLQHFSKEPYLVRSLLLPGHGTRPGDMLDVTHHDWLNACRFGIQSLRKEVQHVSVIAFSAGTALSIYLSLMEGEIDSLVAIAPALMLKAPFASTISGMLYPWREKNSKILWPIFKKEDDFAKYQSYPLNAIYHVTRVMKAIKEINKPLSIPFFMCSSEDDETISHEKAMQFYACQTHPNTRGIVYSKDVDSRLRGNDAEGRRNEKKKLGNDVAKKKK